MASMRVHELAKEFEMTSKELLDRLHEMKIPAKSHEMCIRDSMQGMPHIDPVFYLMTFGVAFVTSFVVTAVVPLARVAAACAVYYDAKPGSVAFRLIQNVFFSTLIMLFLGIVMTAFMTGVGETQALSAMTGELMAVNLFDRFVGLCLQFWPTIVIVALSLIHI